MLTPRVIEQSVTAWASGDRHRMLHRSRPSPSLHAHAFWRRVGAAGHHVSYGRGAKNGLFPSITPRKACTNPRKASTQMFCDPLACCPSLPMALFTTLGESENPEKSIPPFDARILMHEPAPASCEHNDLVSRLHFLGDSRRSEFVCISSRRSADDPLDSPTHATPRFSREDWSTAVGAQAVG